MDRDELAGQFCRPKLRDTVLSRWIDGEWALYEPGSDTTLLLNPSAAAIARRLDGRRSPSEVATGIEASPADVEHVIRDLARQGFVEEGDAAFLGFELAGQRVRVDSTDHELIDGLAQCFSSACRVSARGAWDLHVRVAAERTDTGVYAIEASPPDAGGAVGVFSSRNPQELCGLLNSWFALRDTQFSVFHAGAVAREGRAILLPAASRSGKSTLTAGLLQRGFNLLTDEAGVVDMATRRMRAYPRRLSLRSDVLRILGLDPGAGYGHPDEPARMVEPEELGAVRESAEPQLALIVCPRYRSGAELTVERLKDSAAAFALLESSSSRSRLKERGLDWIIELVQHTPVYSLEFGAMDEALGAIEDLWGTAATAG